MLEGIIVAHGNRLDNGIAQCRMILTIIVVMMLPSSQVQSRFPGLNEVSSVGELVEKLKVLGPDIANLLHLAEKRQKVSSMCQSLP